MKTYTLLTAVLPYTHPSYVNAPEASECTIIVTAPSGKKDIRKIFVDGTHVENLIFQEPGTYLVEVFLEDRKDPEEQYYCNILLIADDPNCGRDGQGESVR